MSSPLHKSPLGLLEAFSLKALGRAPDKFGDVVTPTTDVTQYYLQTLVRTSQALGVAAGFPLSVSSQITGGPIKFHTLATRLNIGAGGGAGTYYIGTIGVRVPTSGPYAPLASVLFPGGITPGDSLDVIYTGPSLLLPAGSEILAQWFSDDVAATNLPIINFLGANLDPLVAQ